MQTRTVSFGLRPAELRKVEVLRKRTAAMLRQDLGLNEFCRAIILREAGIRPGGSRVQVDGAHLRSVREARGLKQAELGTLFSRPQSAVAAWEAGTKPVPQHIAPTVMNWIKTGRAPNPSELTKARGRQRRTAWEVLLSGDFLPEDGS